MALLLFQWGEVSLYFISFFKSQAFLMAWGFSRSCFTQKDLKNLFCQLTGRKVASSSVYLGIISNQKKWHTHILCQKKVFYSKYLYYLTFNKNICGHLMISRLLVTAACVEASVIVHQVVYDQLAAVLVHSLLTWLNPYRWHISVSQPPLYGSWSANESHTK